MEELIKTLSSWLQISLPIVPALGLLIAAGGFLIAVCAFAINVRQTILNNRLMRAKMVSECLSTFMNDEMMQKAFYKIEYSKFKYHVNFHQSEEEEEKQIDKLLRHFSNLALMWERGLLDLKDIQPIQYFILRTMNNSEICEYLSFIDSWVNYAGAGNHPYSSLRNLSTELNKQVNP